MISNDVDINVRVDILFDDIEGHSVVFFSLSGLCYSGKLCSSSIDNILYFFLFKHGLRKIGLLGPVLEVVELLTLCFSVV